MSSAAGIVRPQGRLSVVRQRRIPRPAARASADREVRGDVAVLPGVVLQRPSRPSPRVHGADAARDVDNRPLCRRRRAGRFRLVKTERRENTIETERRISVKTKPCQNEILTLLLFLP